MEFTLGSDGSFYRLRDVPKQGPCRLEKLKPVHLPTYTKAKSYENQVSIQKAQAPATTPPLYPEEQIQIFPEW